MMTGIVTFHAANNYGAVLQAYALQQFISRNYSDVRIVDYQNDKMKKANRMPAISDVILNPKNAIFRMMQLLLYKGKNRKIKEFRKHYLKLTKCYTEETISSAFQEADIFFTGSDQVWNYMITGLDGSYYLDFAKEKTICSYAASFGISNIPDQYKDFYRSKLKDINYISVREQTGQEIIEELCGKSAVIVPDPTLLLNQKEWYDLCIAPKEKKPYILVYKITKADKLLEFAKNLAKEKGLKIIYIPNDFKSGIIGDVKLDVGPREWLGYIRGAEYVVTNSFHGTVFSIIFEKQFFSEVSERVNLSTSRLNNLLQTFDCADHKINMSKDMITNCKGILDKKDILCSQRKIAIRFLDRIYKEFSV